MKKNNLINQFDPRFKAFHELMANKIREILLISTPYDAWIMEEDCRLSERIIHEYRGLNLSHPPRLTWVSTHEDVLSALSVKRFDLVIIMQREADIDAIDLADRIKEKKPRLPVVLLAHGNIPSKECYPATEKSTAIDRIFVWTGDTDILLALIKSVEDRMNVARDTASAGIRVILFVEDSPQYLSLFLPILYKELVIQTQSVLEEGLNEEHRLLTMRARPKILIAETYDDAVFLYKKFEPFILGVISDVRFPKNCVMDDNAGVNFLKKIKKERFDIPLLLTSSEPENAKIAKQIPASFVDKNSPSLLTDVRRFIKDHLGFGSFVVRSPDGKEIARASNLRNLEKHLETMPEDAFYNHCINNDFSRWLFARTEITLASELRPATVADFNNDIEKLRKFIIQSLKERRRGMRKGVIVNFDPHDFDPETDFFKIGKGSLGGKARGLAFMSAILHSNPEIHEKFKDVDIFVPRTLVITTDGFDRFVQENNLEGLAKKDIPDEEIAKKFLKAKFPADLADDLKAYLSMVKRPIAVRSSGLLEDAQFRAYAGLYKTYMLANDHSSLKVRLDNLIDAVKLVWASAYFEGPKAFSKRVGNRTEEEKMAVMIQHLVGRNYGGYFYPAISGVAQSYNYYPFARMKPEEGIATAAMGLGKTVVEGEKTLRFSPVYPQLLPQRSSVEDILENSQRFFYALKMGENCGKLGIDENITLARIEVTDAADQPPMRLLASTYIPEEHRIRDSAGIPGGYPVLTFAQVLKYNSFPLANIISHILDMGQEGMGCPVEIEFSVNLCHEKDCRPQFALLQLRPMTAREEQMTVSITKEDIEKAFCFSESALGNTVRDDIADIIYVKPHEFDPVKTPEIAREIGKMNAALLKEGRKYLLIGPGRWGSADRWLGIPVNWADICGVGAMVETQVPELKADPSQGSHFFHNITTLGINYLTVTSNGKDFLNWDWISSLKETTTSKYLVRVRLDSPVILKVDGRKSHGLILRPEDYRNP